jgi:hypothetical protein
MKSDTLTREVLIWIMKPLRLLFCRMRLEKILRQHCKLLFERRYPGAWSGRSDAREKT